MTVDHEELNVENLLLRTRLMRPVWPTTDVTVTTDLHCEAKKHFYFRNNFVKSRSVLIIFGTQDTWMNLQPMVTKLSISANERHYTTLWNTRVNQFITTVMSALNVMTNWVTDKHITTNVQSVWLWLWHAHLAFLQAISLNIFVWCVPLTLTSAKCQFPWRSDG